MTLTQVPFLITLCSKIGNIPEALLLLQRRVLVGLNVTLSSWGSFLLDMTTKWLVICDYTVETGLKTNLSFQKTISICGQWGDEPWGENQSCIQFVLTTVSVTAVHYVKTFLMTLVKKYDFVILCDERSQHLEFLLNLVDKYFQNILYYKTMHWLLKMHSQYIR